MLHEHVPSARASQQVPVIAAVPGFGQVGARLWPVSSVAPGPDEYLSLLG